MLLFDFLHRLRTVTLCSVFVAAAYVSWGQTPVTTSVIKDFEDSSVANIQAISATNSAGAASGSTFAVISDAGSKRLQILNNDGATNGIVLSIPGGLPSAGNWLITADIKVVSTAAAPTGIDTFGMGLIAGSATTAKIPDYNAGYVMNLYDNATNAAALGYQTVGAAVQSTGASALTIYFSTDPSRSNNTNLPSGDGNHNGSHRTGTNSWAANSGTTYVLIDNIKRIGPGNAGHDRHLWMSVGDGYTNLATLESQLVAAKANNFNAIDILARYRANHYYVANRDFNTYSVTEPFVSGTSTSNDPIQYAIDRGHELGLKVYISFSCFLVCDSSTYPSMLPSGSVMYYYNSGSPRAMLTSDPSSDGGLWADVGRADVRTYTINVLKDFVQNYDIDGVIFDRIRYPTQSYGYNPQAMTDMGISGTPASTDATFMNARRKAVTAFLHDSYEAVTTMKPWVVVGTVPIAYGASFSETYNYVFQAWYMWNTQPTGNRAVSFGCCDIFQPQFYRLYNSGAGYNAPAANQVLMTLARDGDLASFSRDGGLYPGAISMVAPLFYHPNSGDASQSAANAQNICDTEGSTYAMNGAGLYAATKTLADIATIASSSTTGCGSNTILASASPNIDYLMKAGYDKTPPLGITNATAIGGRGNVTLMWTPPAPAADGESASRYLIYRVTSAQRTTAGSVKPYYANLVNRTTTVTGSSCADTGLAAGTYYYKIVPVDDYNNKGPATEVGPVSVTATNLVVESCTGTAINTDTANGKRVYEELNASDVSTVFTGGSGDGFTTSKSSVTNPGLTATKSRISSVAGVKAAFRPNITVSGYYNIYITLDDSSSGPSNKANSNFVITHHTGTSNGSIYLYTGTGGPTGLSNSWKLLASNVPFYAGEANSIVFTNVDGNSTSARFCMDAVRFELVSELTSASSTWLELE